jgi:cysteine synthase A
MIDAVIQEKEKKNNNESAKLLEYTGGSLGVSLALIANLLDMKIMLVLSESSASSTVKCIQDLGAEVHFVGKEKGFLGVINETVDIARRDPSLLFLYQHENRANIMCHYSTTGTELAKQIPVNINAWVASIGTGGTLMGVYHRLREDFPEVALYATNPDELAYGDMAPPNSLKKFGGSGGLGHGKKQRFVMEDEDLISAHFRVSYKECLVCMNDFYLSEGLKIGSSAAANLIAARKISAKKGNQHCTATIFPSLATPEEWKDVENHVRSKHSSSASFTTPPMQGSEKQQKIPTTTN